MIEAEMPRRKSSIFSNSTTAQTSARNSTPDNGDQMPQVFLQTRQGKKRFSGFRNSLKNKVNHDDVQEAQKPLELSDLDKFSFRDTSEEIPVLNSFKRLTNTIFGLICFPINKLLPTKLADEDLKSCPSCITSSCCVNNYHPGIYNGKDKMAFFTQHCCEIHLKEPKTSKIIAKFHRPCCYASQISDATGLNIGKVYSPCCSVVVQNREGKKYELEYFPYSQPSKSIEIAGSQSSDKEIKFNEQEFPGLYCSRHHTRNFETTLNKIPPNDKILLIAGLYWISSETHQFQSATVLAVGS